MYAWKKLNRLDDIDFAHKRRNPLDALYLQLLHTHSKIADIGVFLFAGDDNAIKHLRLHFHADIQTLARVFNYYNLFDSSVAEI